MRWPTSFYRWRNLSWVFRVWWCWRSKWRRKMAELSSPTKSKNMSKLMRRCSAHLSLAPGYSHVARPKITKLNQGSSNLLSTDKQLYVYHVQLREWSIFATVLDVSSASREKCIEPIRYTMSDLLNWGIIGYYMLLATLSFCEGGDSSSESGGRTLYRAFYLGIKAPPPKQGWSHFQ